MTCVTVRQLLLTFLQLISPHFADDAVYSDKPSETARGGGLVKKMGILCCCKTLHLIRTLMGVRRFEEI